MRIPVIDILVKLSKYFRHCYATLPGRLQAIHIQRTVWKFVTADLVNLLMFPFESFESI